MKEKSPIYYIKVNSELNPREVAGGLIRLAVSRLLDGLLSGWLGGLLHQCHILRELTVEVHQIEQG